MSRAERARALACGLLARELPSRWAHVQGVAWRAHAFGRTLPAETTDLLVAASYLHDIGYAEPVRDTGFHPVDGARFLRRLDVDRRIVNLVAHHTCATREADLLGLGAVLDDEFPPDGGLPHDELLYCDLTTGPTGVPTTVHARLADVRHRYTPDTTVHRFVDLAEPELIEAASRAAIRLSLPPAAAIGSPLPGLPTSGRDTGPDSRLVHQCRGLTPVRRPTLAALHRPTVRVG